MANCHRDPKKGRAFRPQDFMPRRHPPEPLAPDQFLQQIILANAALGGKLVEK